MDCVKGHCTHCGIKQLLVCDEEFDSSSLSLVEWGTFEKVTIGKMKDGGIKEVVYLETKFITSLREFLLFPTLKIWEFVMHNFVVQWQDTHFRLCNETLELDEVLSLIDFAKNYSFKHQNEI